LDKELYNDYLRLVAWTKQQITCKKVKKSTGKRGNRNQLENVEIEIENVESYYASEDSSKYPSSKLQRHRRFLVTSEDKDGTKHTKQKSTVNLKSSVS